MSDYYEKANRKLRTGKKVEISDIKNFKEITKHLCPRYPLDSQRAERIVSKINLELKTNPLNSDEDAIWAVACASTMVSQGINFYNAIDYIIAVHRTSLFSFKSFRGFTLSSHLKETTYAQIQKSYGKKVTRAYHNLLRVVYTDEAKQLFNELISIWES